MPRAPAKTALLRARRRLSTVLYYSLCCCVVPRQQIESFVRDNLSFLLPKPKWMGDIVTQETFAQLMLTRGDLGRMNQCFREIDYDDSGSIDVQEFLAYVEAPLTSFSMRVFSIMDTDESGSMDFKEFVIACWNYCSFEKAGLILFAYELYDSDKDGTMSVNECKVRETLDIDRETVTERQ